MWDLQQLGHTNSCAEMRGGTCVFTCNGCREVARLVGEVDELSQMMESMKRIVTGLGFNVYPSHPSCRHRDGYT